MSYQQQLNQLAKKGSKRKTDYCPYCGRPEIVSQDAELVKCSLCAMAPTRLMQAYDHLTGKDIQDLRKRLKKSAVEIAHLNGVSKKYMELMECGKKPIKKKVCEWYVKNNSENRMLPTQLEKR